MVQLRDFIYSSVRKEGNQLISASPHQCRSVSYNAAIMWTNLQEYPGLSSATFRGSKNIISVFST